MVLGDPVAVIAEAVDVPREIDAVLERGRRWRTGRDEGEIEDGKGRHALQFGIMSLRIMRIGAQEESGLVSGNPVRERVQAAISGIEQNEAADSLRRAAISQDIGGG